LGEVNSPLHEFQIWYSKVMTMSTPENGYFERLSRQTRTEFWINNATLAEAEAALSAGAVCATTNPTYLARLLKEEPDYVAKLIDETLPETDDDSQVADSVYQKAVAPLQRLFYPLYKQTRGRYGYVALQGDPHVNTDFGAILEGALRYRRLGENIIIKVPAWPAGATALERLVAMEIPTIATLGFSVDQAVYMAEAYRRALQKSETRPVCYVTFIAGVLDTHLAELSAQKGNIVSREAIQQAGCTATRVAYRIYKSRRYEAILLGGGARGSHHFTELVGGEMAITIGLSLAHQILQADGPVVSRIDAETPPQVISELEAHFPDFRKSYCEHSLRPEEFHEFGPVAAFQGTFLAGIDTVLKAIASRRRAAALGEVGVTYANLQGQNSV
jgi:transaldolase